MTIWEKLSAPFHPSAVSWRIGARNNDKTKGMPLAYIDARDVQDRLNEACGPDGWQVRYPWSQGDKLYCEIGIRTFETHSTKNEGMAAQIDVKEFWLWRGDGAGDTDVEASKGAFSDAFKRAAVRFGVGRYLYDLPNAWVDLVNEKLSPQMHRELTERLAKWQISYFEKKEKKDGV